MKRALGSAAIGAAVAVLSGILTVGPAQASVAHAEFLQTNLVSNLSTQGAQLEDQSLQNPWGLALSATSPLWVSDNNSGLATVYRINVGGTTVTKSSLTVTVPGGRASTGDASSPTGQVFNPTPGFVVTSGSGSGPAAFIFDSESGQVTAWNPSADPIAAGLSTGQVEYSSPTAVYKGLAIATGDAGTYLYATNFHDGTVDVFNSQFQPVVLAGGFSDANLPAGYAPFGIADIHNLLYVTYAKQDKLAHDDVAGAGHGFVDVYTPDGFLVERLASRGPLDSPWGLAIAPSSFGPFAGMLLVGDFGDGRINVFDPFSGRHLGHLSDPQGKAIGIDGLWSLTVGTVATGGTQTVLFSAGINGENDGLLGSLNAAG